MITNLIWMIFFTPMVPEQEWAQKIFYLHVPIAWSGFLAYFIVMISGVLFLLTKNLKYDTSFINEHTNKKISRMLVFNTIKKNFEKKCDYVLSG